MSKKSLTKRLLTFYNRCIVLVRVFNFNDQLVLQLGKYQDYLFNSSQFVKDKDILVSNRCLQRCKDKMEVKARADEKVQSDEVFQNRFKEFRQQAINI
jgi:hypothetical protein